MRHRWSTKIRIIIGVALLSAGVTESLFFVLSQAYYDSAIPAWAFTPWWVVLLRSTVPVILYELIKYARLCDCQRRHEAIRALRESHAACSRREIAEAQH
jgi:uncharacterized membrane protein YcjF (UPF0283 family)